MAYANGPNSFGVAICLQPFTLDLKQEGSEGRVLVNRCHYLGDTMKMLAVALLCASFCAPALAGDAAAKLDEFYPSLVRMNDILNKRPTTPSASEDQKAFYMMGFVSGAMSGLRLSSTRPGRDISCAKVSDKATISSLIATIDLLPATREQPYAMELPLLLQHMYPCLDETSH